mgnify:CR=1 FL=1
MDVVEPLDVVEQGKSGRVARRERVSSEQFAFEGGKETLRHRVVPALADPTHAQGVTVRGARRGRAPG